MTVDAFTLASPPAYSDPLEFKRDGARLFAGLLDEAALDPVERAFDAQDAKPGVRLSSGVGELRELLYKGIIGDLAREEQGSASRPVRILLFNKKPGMNWALGFHQDRTIAVARRVEVDRFDPWSVKDGQPHVQPPQSMIDRMLTLRIHLDDTGVDAAPLLILPGSHRLGRLSEGAIEAIAGRTDPFACVARRGDVWVYATSIVHGSKAFAAPRGQRRVLQVDYAAEDLPGGLKWALAI